MYRNEFKKLDGSRVVGLAGLLLRLLRRYIGLWVAYCSMFVKPAALSNRSEHGREGDASTVHRNVL